MEFDQEYYGGWYKKPDRAALRRERMAAARRGETYAGYCPRCNDGTQCIIVNKGKRKGLYCKCTRPLPKGA